MKLLLEKYMLEVLKKIGLPTDFSLEIKGYSVTHEGKYLYATHKIILYVYKDREMTEMYSSAKLLSVLIHEAIHYLQHINPQHIRYKGIVHDREFYALEQQYLLKARSLGYLSATDEDLIAENGSVKGVAVECT